jgi:hypothetical protein
MRKLSLLLFMCLFCTTVLAQQNVTVNGLIQWDEPLPDTTRVSIQVVDRDNAWRQEVASVQPVGGTFSIGTTGPVPETLQPFRSGAVVLPGLQTEYRVSPEVNYAIGRLGLYVDQNDTQRFERESDCYFVGIVTSEDTLTYLTLLYVDQDATLSGRNAELQLLQGWNVLTVQAASETGELEYDVQQTIDGVVVEVLYLNECE